GNRWEQLLPALAIVLWGPTRQTIMTWRVKSDWVYAIAFALLAGISILRLGGPMPFLSFQFLGIVGGTLAAPPYASIPDGRCGIRGPYSTRGVVMTAYGTRRRANPTAGVA